jgi:cellulose synthase operon protein YhjQ
MTVKPHLPADVDALCVSVGLDVTSYRTFATEPGIAPATGHGVDAEFLQALYDRFDARPAPHDGERYLALRPVLEASLDNWQADGGVLRPLAPPVVILPAAGGCGTSTVVATLSRLLSDAGERVAVVDSSARSTLAMHFGARSARFGTNTFSTPGDDRVIHAILPDPEGAVSDSDDWVVRGLAQLADDYDRLLLDVSGHIPRKMAEQLVPRALAFIVVTPDLRGAHGLGSALSRLREFAPSLQPYFLLNQFDSGLRLHVEFQARLRAQAGDRLLNITLRRTDVVPEALARGRTVADFCPDADITEDYRRLAEWIRCRTGASRGAEEWPQEKAE